ncbi:GAF and ANTAR domain-containing protein [Amycolatopsis anabasis]|uniref:GAF and ANTAR domain-containing protein n=1 Tax=Amycolatopsis anabasis TaxID=1840409 RepID=UPI00131C8370|nr:GAF and ANTAR domain-containing protein [Amycolatopsis anabasis]
MDVQRHIAHAFVELADTLDAEFEVSGFLRLLARHCQELLGIDAAAVFLAEPEGGLRLAVSTGIDTRLTEFLAATPGPAADCAGEYLANLGARESAARWPDYAVQVRAAGFELSHALPMRRRDAVIGALLLLKHGTERFAESDVVLAQAMTETATIGLMQHLRLHEREELAAQLQTALRSRVIIEQAKGVLAERQQIGLDEAFTLLRGHARQHRRRLAELAAAVVDGLPLGRQEKR